MRICSIIIIFLQFFFVTIKAEQTFSMTHSWWIIPDFKIKSEFCFRLWNSYTIIIAGWNQYLFFRNTVCSDWGGKKEPCFLNLKFWWVSWFGTFFLPPFRTCWYFHCDLHMQWILSWRTQICAWRNQFCEPSWYFLWVSYSLSLSTCSSWLPGYW